MEYTTILDQFIPERRCLLTGKFLKGHIPFNKGTKGKSNKGSFKKGDVPKNILPVGTISVRFHRRDKKHYKYIKVADSDKWETLNRYNWKLHNGDIPAGYLVGHKDGDTLNCEPDNLFLLSRAENVRRNFDVEKVVATKKKKKINKNFEMWKTIINK